jgi:hypothetical protein
LRFAPVRVASRALFVAALLATASASATPPDRDALGARFTVVSTGPVTTVDVRLVPRTSFSTVTVERGSGAASISPACTFQAVVPGGSYVCRVNVTAIASEPSFTLNVVGTVEGPSGSIPRTQVANLTVLNSGYSREKAGKAPAQALMKSTVGDAGAAARR